MKFYKLIQNLVPVFYSRKRGTMDTSLDTPLLSACKALDKDKLNEVMQNIAEKGISKEELNAVDANGRTALSLICTTQATQLLDIMLRLPEIDVNKADNDGNTPLHYAVESGQSEIISIICNRRYVNRFRIDAKNIFGLTPLMKAAVQGRTACCKRLISAKASAVETDIRRGFNAQQFAILCGRTFCAAAIADIIKNDPKYEAKAAQQADPNMDETGMLSKFRRIMFGKRLNEHSSTIDHTSVEQNYCELAERREAHNYGYHQVIPIIEVTPPTPTM